MCRFGGVVSGPWTTLTIDPGTIVDMENNLIYTHTNMLGYRKSIKELGLDLFFVLVTSLKQTVKSQ